MTGDQTAAPDRRVRGDEQRLLQHFGASYAGYCRRVKRWIAGLI